jgi:hypothetical protein
MGLIVARIVQPQSKLATVRSWEQTTLGRPWASVRETNGSCMGRWSDCSSTRVGSSGV